MKMVLYPKRGTVAKVSEIPQCNFCLNKAEYDAKTKMGMWAYLCNMHFAILGIGLGTGKGQKLELEGDKDKKKDKHLKEIYRNSLKLTEGLRKEVNKLQQDNEYLPLEKWIDKFNEQLAEIVLIKMNIENELKSGNYSQKKEKENEKI